MPISLCNTFYKVIANRIRNILPNSIHPAQSTFIKESDVSKNIVLAHDIYHDFYSSPNLERFIAKLEP